MAIQRKAALTAWDDSLDSLSDAFTSYNNRTSSLFTVLAQDDDGSASSSREPTLEDALQHIDTRLLRLQDLESRLHNARIALQGLRNTSTILAPVGRLPPEIISYIIHIGDLADQIATQEKDRLAEEEDIELDSNGDEILPDTPDPPHFPTLISHVCSRWRRIALENPVHWSHIDFVDGAPFDRAQEWLERSKSCELDVALDADDDLTELSSPEKLRMALALLKPHATRISALYARGPTIIDIAEIIFSLTEHGKPMPLKSLSMIADEAEEETDFGAFSGKLPVLKAMLAGLEALELERIPLPWDYVTLKGLKELRLSSLPPPDAPNALQVYAILSESRNLTLLEIDAVDMMGLDEEEPLPLVPIKFPKLNEVLLSQLDGPQARFLLSVIDAPNVFRTRLSDLFIPTGDRKVLVAFFHRMSPAALRRLRIDGCSFEEADYILMLGETPSLEELHFSECDGIGNQLFNWLQGKKTALLPCPDLVTLRLDSCETFEPSPFKAFIEARSAAGRPLKSVTVKYCGLEPELQQWLKDRVPEVVWEMDSDHDDPLMGDDEEMTTDGEDVEMDAEGWDGIEDP